MSKKKAEPEYSLHIFPRFDDRTQARNTVFVVQTVKEFTSFQYEILLDSRVEGELIQLKIRGLRTTPLTMPNVGPARGVREYPNLKGLYRLVVSKLDDAVNEFTLNISDQVIQIRGKQEAPFLRVSPEPLPLP